MYILYKWCKCRYKDDIFDRLWLKANNALYYPINGDIDINPASTNDSYKLPTEVLKSAAQSFNVSYGLVFDYDNTRWKHLDRTSEYYVYFHFLEIQKLPQGQKRIINISVSDGKNILEPIILEYLKPQTIVPQYAFPGNVRFMLRAASGSNAPPILNSFEVYQLISPITPPTDERDGTVCFNFIPYFQSCIYLFCLVLDFWDLTWIGNIS